MKRLFVLAAVVLLGAPVAADPMNLNLASVQELSNCAANGASPAAITVRPGRYWLRTFDEDVWICAGATCASGGHRLPIGERVVVLETSTVLSCRSTSATGDVVLTPVKRPVSGNW